MNRSKLIVVYFVTLIGLLFYSYALVDPNITIINHPLWTSFRNVMVQLGYFQRNISTGLFLMIISALSLLHFKFMKKPLANPVKLALLTAGILLCSYPFLSRDLFNYMFDARILTFHHANPYLHAALDFPDDQWLRFMHWTHRPYPYGPTFLPITLVPSFLSAGKFVLNLLFFKLMFACVYVWIVYMLSKMKKEYGIFFATHPVIILEGLVNNHNDLIAVMLAIMGIYYASSKFISMFSYLASSGIKFITTPVLLLFSSKNKTTNAYLSFVVMIGLILYLSWKGEFQQWYVLNFFIFIPLLYPLIKKSYLFAYGVLLSYYPFLLYGEWNTKQNLFIKHIVILLALALNGGWLLFDKYRVKKLNR